MSLISDFPRRCDIYAPEEARVSTGTTSQAWTNAVYTCVPCRLQPRMATEGLQAGRVSESQYAVLFCPAKRGSVKIDIRQKYRIVMRNDRTRTWLVLGSRDPDSQGRFQAVELEERR